MPKPCGVPTVTLFHYFLSRLSTRCSDYIEQYASSYRNRIAERYYAASGLISDPPSTLLLSQSRFKRLSTALRRLSDSTHAVTLAPSLCAPPSAQRASNTLQHRIARILQETRHPTIPPHLCSCTSAAYLRPFDNKPDGISDTGFWEQGARDPIHRTRSVEESMMISIVCLLIKTK